ncbi:hypothetical protein D9Q98_004186 [Chlorella vulgaris]|uniref:Uncharacterized protein n=1 Tax=Chlorella vulgaris TaxID=3077 RepID=A0A9D4YY57_CHLVU|nr:hypothetical protein D9Q98_004186 [Chlorella vulgaris]
MEGAGTIPFSTHARGVPLFDKTHVLDVPRHVARLLLSLRDVSGSGFWFLACQSWLTLHSFLITIVSVCFFTFFETNGQPLAAQLDWVLICSVAVLPAVGFLWIAYMRRERALDELTKAKVLMMGLYRAHRDWLPAAQEDHLAGVRDALAELVDAMHTYFLPGRFYSRNYPFMGFRSAMVHIALERARQLRRIASSMDSLDAAAVSLHGGPLSPALVAQLHDRNQQLQLSIQRMANVKEFGTPQGVRSLSRFYLVLFLPIFFGPYWSWVAANTNFAFAFFFSILLQTAVTGLVNVTIALEDPFDNNGMDGVFIEEALYEVQQLIGSTRLPLGAERWQTNAAAVPAQEAVPPGNGVV